MARLHEKREGALLSPVFHTSLPRSQLYLWCYLGSSRLVKLPAEYCGMTPLDATQSGNLFSQNMTPPNCDTYNKMLLEATKLYFQLIGNAKSHLSPAKLDNPNFHITSLNLSQSSLLQGNQFSLLYALAGPCSSPMYHLL